MSELTRDVAARLAPLVSDSDWAAPFLGPEAGFRNKAKLVVGGTKVAPTFGILDGDRRGVDLRDCGLYEPFLAESLPRLTDAVSGLGLVPYDVNTRSGELKHLIVTASPDRELMVRFVLRSPGQLPRIREAMVALQAAVPGLRVVTANLQPEHKAVLEGPEEIVLSRAEWLPMRLDDITFHLRPRSFFQTNSVVAAGLYQQAREWVHDVAPRSVLDLYCGVGGFALNAAVATGGPTRQVHGVEVAPDAVASARDAAAALRVDATFAVGDARVLQGVSADLVVVNPPRRGVGPDLCRALTAAAPEHVIYSSCNATSLATDLAGLPDHRVESARLFDMFPQTRHHEVIVLLRRR